MEKTSSNTLSPSFSLAGFIVFLLFDGALKWVVIGLKKFFSASRFFSQSHIDISFGKSKEKKPTRKTDDGRLSTEDVQMVMEKLRIVCDPTDKITHESLGSNELSALFEDREPSLEEVKEAFDVFDGNRDGFVDAADLQRVLCSLGHTEGSNVDNCKKMIRVFDEDRDGRIDFNDFVKLMESSFC